MWAPIDLIPAFFFDVKFLVMCWKFPFSAKGGESGGRPLVDGSLDYSSLIQHPPTPSIDTERSPINVTVALGKTALLTCRIRGFNNRTVNRQQKKRIISSKRSGSTCVQWSSLVRSKGCWIITLSASGLFAGNRRVDWKRKEKRTEKRLRRTIVVV